MESKFLLKDVFMIGAMLVGIVTYVYVNFATKEDLRSAILAMRSYVDQKHTEALNHSDMNRAALEKSLERTTATLQDIKDTVKSIDIRAWRDNERSFNRK